MKAIVQEHAMGCAVSCVAYLTKISYKKSLGLFPNPKLAAARGSYCSEITLALKKKKLIYKWIKISPKAKNLLKEKDIIVFIGKSEKYPLGHFLLKTNNGWMNPWVNFPCIAPAKAGFEKTLPGKAQWIIYPSKSK